jgi:1,4-alpha-glucan branching enzyme
LDGQWGIDEVYSIRAATYDTWSPGQDDSGDLKSKMDSPPYWGRSFYQVTRFGESHDLASAQDPANQRIAARPPWGQGYHMAKAMGSLTLLTNGIPMLFIGQEVGETQPFLFDNNNLWVNPQMYDLPPAQANDQTRILNWIGQIMGLRNDPSKGLQGNANYQVVATGNRTLAFVCGADQGIFTVVTFGTPNQQQNSSWLGLPQGIVYEEIFNSSWPAFQVASEPECTNGGYAAQIGSGQILNLPSIGTVVLERI